MNAISVIILIGLCGLGLSVVLTVIFAITKKKKAVNTCLAFMFAFAVLFVAALFVAPNGGKGSEIAAPSPEPSVSPAEAIDFDELYQVYKDNEIVANEQYKGNRYRFIAEINGINEGGGLIDVFDTDLGAKLTLVKQVGSTIVYIGAEFDKDQVESLKQIKVGDTVTIEGECYSDTYWIECELVIE